MSDKINWKELELGALWISRSGKSKYNGKLKLNGKDVSVIVMENTFKKPDDNSPDFRLYLSPPRDAAPTPGKAPTSGSRSPAPPKSVDAPPTPPSDDVPW